MNYRKWNEGVYPGVLALKLCEEAAEVGTELTDAEMMGRPVSVEHLHEELDHVEHLVNVFRKKFPLPS